MKTAAVIGSGPNGLTAAIELQKAGYRTTVIEAQAEIGGGTRSAALTLPGFIHDVCSAVHPMAISSPALRRYPLGEHGLEWIQPPLPLAHPLDGGRVAVLARSIDETVERLGGEPEYRRLARAFTRRWFELIEGVFRPFTSPRFPLLMARFGFHAIRPALWEARGRFDSEEGRALFAGIAAHAILPLSAPASAAFGWLLALAGHAVGWPIPRGGSQSIANSLASYFQSLGGQIVASTRVRSVNDLRESRLVLCDVSPREFLRIAGERLPAAYAKELEHYRYGPGAFKMDWALNGPIPWANSDCALAGTVHLGGTLQEVSRAEKAPWRGRAAQHPFLLLTQPSLFDSSRAPAGCHTAWAYAHVPNNSPEDLTERVENQIERFAPGFRARVLARHVIRASEWEERNSNYPGGDVVGGAQLLRQLVLRPTWRLYDTPLPGVFLCSASTPPGGGVHGMCGYHAAQRAIAFDR